MSFVCRPESGPGQLLSLERGRWRGKAHLSSGRNVPHGFFFLSSIYIEGEKIQCYENHVYIAGEGWAPSGCTLPLTRHVEFAKSQRAVENGGEI